MRIGITMLFSLIMILFGAELFTNAVEWFGRKLGLGQGAVGSVLAAIGTALPETAVPVTAILFGTSHQAEDVGIGGILGAPFLLSTLGALVMAIALLVFRRRDMPTLQLPMSSFRRDMTFFIVAYAIALIVGCTPSLALRRIAPIVLILLYLVFLVVAVRERSTAHLEEDELKPLYLAKGATTPSMPIVIAQLLLALVLIVGGAHLLTGGVSHIATWLRLPAFVLSVIVIPLATELPETLNSVVWIRQKKDSLAIGNITGAMVFQSTLVPAMGISLTPWKLTPEALMTGSLTLAAAAFTFGMASYLGGLQIPTLLIASTLYWVLPLQTVIVNYPTHVFPAVAAFSACLLLTLVFCFLSPPTRTMLK